MPGRRVVRDATPADAAACAVIYAPYVEGTAVSFEERPPSADEMAARITSAQERHAWLVCEDDGRVVGYAYGGTFRTRAAYRWTAEVSVYLEQGLRRSGAGRALYEALLARLAERGFRTAVAGMTEPNEASTALHLALGFERVGTLRDVGFKDGRWHATTWFQRPIGPHDASPAETV